MHAPREDERGECQVGLRPAWLRRAGERAEEGVVHDLAVREVERAEGGLPAEEAPAGWQASVRAKLELGKGGEDVRVVALQATGMKRANGAIVRPLPRGANLRNARHRTSVQDGEADGGERVLHGGIDFVRHQASIECMNAY
eukprot:1192974-Prorocentrum_minimum.AAC.1